MKRRHASSILRLFRARAAMRGLRDARGGATVEFALWMPVFAFLVMLSADVGVLAYRYSQMWDVARSAVRDISIGGLPRTQGALDAFVHERLSASHQASLIDAHTTYFTVEIVAPSESLMAFGVFEATLDGMSRATSSSIEFGGVSW